MKVKYIGKSFGADGLTNEKIYEVIEIDRELGALRIIDDSGEDYLYSPVNPKPPCKIEPYGKFEVIEDDELGTLQKAVDGIIE